jgi:thiamine biosynthesis lipoprotein
MCTSSIRLGRWQDAGGRQVHHLIDPATGEPGGGGLVSVTVAGPDPAWSEIWSKALFIAGARAIAAEARGRGLAAWWIDEDGLVSMTPAARASTIWP